MATPCVFGSFKWKIDRFYATSQNSTFFLDELSSLCFSLYINWRVNCVKHSAYMYLGMGKFMHSAQLKNNFFFFFMTKSLTCPFLVVSEESNLNIKGRCCAMLDFVAETSVTCSTITDNVGQCWMNMWHSFSLVSNLKYTEFMRSFYFS